jgi:hypothetical protein
MEFLFTIAIAIASGVIAYLTATKKTKSNLEAFRIAYQDEVKELVSQHKSDLETLKRKHKHELELQQKELINDPNCSH